MKRVLVPVVASRAHLAGAAAIGLLFCSQACRRAAPPAPPPPRAAAVVNGAPIPLTRVQLELDRMRRGSAEGEAKVPPQDVPQLARAILDALVDRTVVLQRAKAAGMAVGGAEGERGPPAPPDEKRRGGGGWAGRPAP